LYPTAQNIIPAIEYKPIFLAQITDTLFDVTKPDSSMQKPAAIHITRNPPIKNNKVFNTKLTSGVTVVSAKQGVVDPIKNNNGNNNLVIFIKLPVKNLYNYGKFNNINNIKNIMLFMNISYANRI
jgi:hypothetical protein